MRTTEQVDLARVDQEVNAAEAEAAEAAALVEALEERVRDGDESVTPEQIEQAKSLCGFAKLRVEAARRKAERARQKAAEAARRKAAAEVRERLSRYTDEALAERYRDARDALRKLAAACHERNAAIGDCGMRLRSVGFADLDTPALLASGGTGACGVGTPRIVVVDGQRFDKVDIGALVARLVVGVAEDVGGLPLDGGTDLAQKIRGAAYRPQPVEQLANSGNAATA
ncbi:hypothetical protein [Carbonactinospora thermoautotrophica]|uniref:hypothetical protein n=1 Tax=Carbonactinospora thermoautotrophica TaxID=1469144 RepID=UPI00082CD33F|nr:hypothetical protein [Carbonactinospora thermoautotrophica]